jgi:hypothetical protein
MEKNSINIDGLKLFIPPERILIKDELSILQSLEATAVSKWLLEGCNTKEAF